MLYATRRLPLIHLDDKEKQLLKRLCILSRDIYNTALQNIKSHYDRTGKFLFWIDNMNLIRTLPLYNEIGSRYQAIVQEADSDFRVYHTIVECGSRYSNIWQMYDHWGKSTPPEPKKSFFPIVCTDFEQRDGKIRLPLSIMLAKEYLPIYIKLPSDIRNVCIVRFVIRPRHDFSAYDIFLTYETQKQPQELDYTKCLSIDLGLNNFATVCDSDGKSFIIDGRYLKSIIQGCEKQMSKIRNIKQKQSINGYTKREKHIMDSRQRKINDYLNKSVKYISDYCLRERIGNVIVGCGYSFSNSQDLSFKNSQIFSQIPYHKFLQKLDFKCQKLGIRLIKQNECYTSKASFIDNDPIPDMISRRKYVFSGNRVFRGLYVSKNGIKLNADQNASLNIMRKANERYKLVSPEKIRALQCRGDIVPPSRINLLKLSCKKDKTLKPYQQSGSSTPPTEVKPIQKGVAEIDKKP